ncbi:MAG: DUF4233 domain-containing protein [Frankiales bacterium]|nr:DUF4233 domain-containing protein [Frankiales bacterium]
MTAGTESTERGAPPRGLVGVGIGGLALETIVLLLAAPAVATAERGHVHAWHVVVPLLLAVLTGGAAAVLRRPRGLLAGTVLQPLVIAAGVVTWPLYVVGGLFAAIWVYYLRLWRPPN